jgi:hypothetical protein
MVLFTPTRLGSEALFSNTDGNDNTAVGYQTLHSNTTGFSNSAVGMHALYSNDIGHYNTAVGYEALYSNDIGLHNSALGWGALYSNTTGWGSTAVGTHALYSNEAGWNSAMGNAALYSNTTGSGNTAVGRSALQGNNEGNSNTAMGECALNSNTTGGGNTAVGYWADYWNQKGSRNTMIGFMAGFGTIPHDKSGNVFIGYGAGYDETGDNKLYIANDDTSTPLIYGDFSAGRVGIGTNPSEALDVSGTARLRGIGAQAGTTYVHVDGNGKLWKIGSSKRYKTNIRDLETNPDAVLQLRPVRFQWKTTGQEDVGLVAEEVHEVLNDLTIYDNEGRPEAVRYDRVGLYLVGVVKELRAENQSLRERVEALERASQRVESNEVKEVQQ